MSDQKKVLLVRVAKSQKTGKLFFTLIFICFSGDQLNLGFVTKDKVAELLDISPRKVDLLECKDYEVL